jgi:GNAT superfamily N-acetyltransferase
MGVLKPIDPLVRLIRPDDNYQELTDLLHRAYGVLAARGMKFLASHQDEKMTRERAAEGECYVAIHEGRIIGTIVWRNARQTSGTPWYDRPDVASFGQFAVEPALQRCGIGSMLVAIAEHRSATTGAAELALDTAEPAQDLVRFYTQRGYRFIDYTQWGVVNYRSLILSKPIAPKRAKVQEN